MKLEEIEKLWEQDGSFDTSNILGEITSIPKLHHKYLTILMHEKLTRDTFRQHHDRVYKARWEYYTGRAEPEAYRNSPFSHKLQKADTEMYLNADEEVQKSSQKLIIQQSKIEFLESVIKLINNRSFLIRDYIEWSKFTNGVG
jgi:hypothetical protein